MIRCNNCGSSNIDGSEYCDECGMKLSVAVAQPPRQQYAPPEQFITQVAPPPPPSFTKENVTPKPATPYTPPPPPPRPSPGQPPASRPAERPPAPGDDRQPERSRPPDSAMNPAAQPATPRASNFPPPPNIAEPERSRTQNAGPPTQTGVINGQTNALRGAEGEGGRRQAGGEESAPRPVGAKLIIQRGGKVGKEFPITGTESMIGRWDADGGIFPDIDLDQDDPEAKVSRRHARIQFLNNQYLIEDLGSTNGTFVNRGPRLAPGAKQPLNNGDEIIVGKTFLKFVLN